MVGFVLLCSVVRGDGHSALGTEKTSSVPVFPQSIQSVLRSQQLLASPTDTLVQKKRCEWREGMQRKRKRKKKKNRTVG
jgi:hypothetical protein